MDIWEKVLRELQNQINPSSFEMWFKPTRLRSFNNQELQVVVPDEHFVSWLREHYLESITRVLRTFVDKMPEIHFVVDDTFKAKVEEKPTQLELPIQRVYYPRQRPRKMTPVRNPWKKPSPFLLDTEEPNLNPRYTFETYVVGTSNQFAHAASRAVAEQLSTAYNPLFIYGGVGLGKTHLMHAIGHAVRKTLRSIRLFYASSERFMNELIHAIRYDAMPEFRRKYRNIDLLLIDDIQFIAGKERTQEEFFHTFNALYDARKQIVISSDCPPKQIPTLEERLRSRFEWGLIADIQPPDLETKIAILKKKAELEKVGLPDDVALFIASKIKSNIRELEGSLIKVAAYSSLTGQEITLELAQQVLKDLLSPKEKNINIDLIQKVVSDYYNVSSQEMKSQSRARAIAFPRQVAMYLSKELTRSSLPEIGKNFGGKDHTTVIHACQKIKEKIAKDPNFKQVIEKLKGLVTA
ncbi:MAG TPA: chromosomal replication initiator protein DnaA [Candidatus Limnocylindrales bacterium]|nr:chromosomal replication initiator protein DnaA [Candidatus Limnocylindrales bacterium]